MPATFSRLLGPSRTVALAYPEAFADLETPTAAELNNAAMVFNITCCLLESDTTIGVDDSETNDDLHMCSIGSDQTLTTSNVTIELVGEKDARRETTEVAGVFWNLVKEADIPLVLIDRIGYSSDTPFAVGQEISYYVITTDNAIRQLGDRTPIRISQSPSFSGDLNIGYAIAA